MDVHPYIVIVIAIAIAIAIAHVMAIAVTTYMALRSLHIMYPAV